MNNISVHRFVYYVLYYSPKTGGKLGRILELILEMLVLHHISKVVKQNLDIESAVYEAATCLLYTSFVPIQLSSIFCKKIGRQNEKKFESCIFVIPFLFNLYFRSLLHIFLFEY
jgi:hypothetical protein